jgi:maltose alpha-D-glucosyltransferase / alpha-amylase
MSERWYKEAVIYCVEVDAFQDSNGDGCGDLPGLISRLDYLARLGITCLWLNPIHPSPHRDDGYDVSDYYAVDPRLGSLGDFAELALEAAARGIRLIVDLVVNHTSDAHPWFRSARASTDSPYRDWYVWSDSEPPDRRQGIVFPGEQKDTWTFDEQAQAWYYHRFYDFQPDLNWRNPKVHAEIKKVMAFWLQLGADGFRSTRHRSSSNRSRPASTRARWTSPSSTTGGRKCNGGEATLCCCARRTSPPTRSSNTRLPFRTARTLGRT